VIRPYRHNKFKLNKNLIGEVINQFELRLSDEPNLNYLKQVRERYDLNKNKKLITLNIENRQTQKELRKDWLLEIENKRREANGLKIFTSYKEMENFNDDQENFNENIIDLKKDYELLESTKIINDFINLSKDTMLSSSK